MAKASKTSGRRFPIRNSAALKALAANVRKLRTARGWSQDELAAEVDLTQDAISLIENGRANPTILTVEQIAEACGIPFLDLFEAPARSPRSKG
ncbi:helix-turn-helix transcriptional regulator [Bradyrhizobium sp. SSUT18]|uniref:helix-turn-helix transcriptional regulator n=1 Tax=Bradyrhizobium sp. SSUT18 TaxID=3040602 RepID=UPI0024491238|nr:helix-turn-helix transcriptional regulator [Bradyrhizobium sp. SSUT18]MDH2399830.1 helix-turn-helix transcriptional regulator [Bradyrhizobium sp. SSUT18]